MTRHGYRSQRTIARTVEVRGVGFLTGAAVRLRFQPAGPHTGVVFMRRDRAGAPEIEAGLDNVAGTHRRTTLGRPPVCVELVEHVLAALAGLRIDNCRVELDAPEPPGLDGSALGFVRALCRAGVAHQNAERAIWAVDRPISVQRGEGRLTLYPDAGNGLRVSYLLDYGWQSSLGVQRHTHDATPEGFLNGLCNSRTFLRQEEAEQLRQQGFGRRATWADLLVFGPKGPIHNRLRFADEPARHKLLDLIGDLSLLGCDLQGHLVAHRSGHTLNVELARKVAGEMANGPRQPLRLAA